MQQYEKAREAVAEHDAQVLEIEKAKLAAERAEREKAAALAELARRKYVHCRD